jgi:phosphohistidine swiveling domain-containing protein
LSPEAGARFSALLRDVGHRGPGETELENETFGDRPDLLLGAVVKALDAEPRLAGTDARLRIGLRLAANVMHRWLRLRERARDAVARQTHALRLAVREVGCRAAAAGDLAVANDVFYLDYDELFTPALHAAKVPERRRERERLRAIHLPRAFELRWEPVDVAKGALTALSGLGVSPGVVEGPARVVTDGDAAFLEPGEILVAHVTDVGWTSLFTWAAAVVTDIGGTLSHAAIVAREIGIPCVVGTEHATQALRTGQRVRVDGTAGTVEIIE